MVLARTFDMLVPARIVACLAAYSCGYAWPALAEVPPAGSDWDACVNTPTRSCVLREALAAATARASPSPDQLRRIAEAYSAAGDVDAAFRVIPSIRADGVARASVLRSIASAQAKSGRTDQARDTFAQAQLLAETIEKPLARAEATLAIAKGEEEAGFTAEASALFAATRELAETVEIKPAPDHGCVIMPSPEDRLDSVFDELARHEANAGDLKQARELTRRIQYGPSSRVAALQAIAEIMAGAGRSDDARGILEEARDAAGPLALWPDRHPSCPNLRIQPPHAGYHVYSLCNVAKVQAKLGLVDAAATTLDAASVLIADIADGPILKARVAIVSALTEIAEAESEAGLRARAGASFDRAIKMAADVAATDGAGIFTLMRLSRALVRAGRNSDGEHLSESVLVTVRSRDASLERANQLLLVIEARDDAGLPHDRDLLFETQEALRLVGLSGERMISLARLAQAWVRAGEMHEAMGAFEEALASLEATPTGPRNSNLLLQAIRGVPVPDHLAGLRDSRLIAAAAPHILKIIQERGDPDANTSFQRTVALLTLSGALPD
jgi:tetratricopeptide (TPR) repeat protein